MEGKNWLKSQFISLNLFEFDIKEWPVHSVNWLAFMSISPIRGQELPFTQAGKTPYLGA